MTVALADIGRCFGGEIPSVIATCSASGEPNLAHLSQVYLVDEDHVATSNQFFTTTAANLLENPFATLLTVDPVDLTTFKLLVRHECTEDAGERFEAARRSIEAIASMTGMEDTFALRAVDVFRVLEVALVPSRGTVGRA